MAVDGGVKKSLRSPVGFLLWGFLKWVFLMISAKNEVFGTGVQKEGVLTGHAVFIRAAA